MTNEVISCTAAAAERIASGKRRRKKRGENVSPRRASDIAVRNGGRKSARATGHRRKNSAVNPAAAIARNAIAIAGLEKAAPTPRSISAKNSGEKAAKPVAGPS